MSVPGAATAGPPSLLAVTVRRTLVTGRTYLVAGIGMTVLYSSIFSLVPGNAFGLVYPVLLPILAVTGGLGGLMVFTSDRTKGVFEYLLAYGISPNRLFTNVLVASLVAATLVLSAGTAAGLGLYLAVHRSLPGSLLADLGAYSYPMSYATIAFAATVGMFWTSLSSPREGLNSPIGLVPIVGVAPPLVTLFAAIAVETSMAFPVWVVTTAAIGAVAVVDLLLLGLIGRFLRRERLLSPT